MKKSFVECVKQQAIDKAPENHFGRSVSIHGDWQAVGAPGRNNDTGAAYLFESNGGAWTQPPQKLQACDKGRGDFFGISVSISGDRAAVGADRQDEGAPNPGAAYLFESSPCGFTN